jgi:hypothetical protein
MRWGVLKKTGPYRWMVGMEYDIQGTTGARKLTLYLKITMIGQEYSL